MALAAGTRIGSYELLSLLGAGGMGEVYRAHDRQLQRDVALKLLPDGFASDADRLVRFEREAQILASLNHSNIAQVYGLDGSGATRCIVMELVEGETLQDRLRRGPIPIDEAVPIALQLADALEAAHARGIVHRDLKPANIKVTPAGKVKVLDFGLSKAMNPELPSDLSQSPTVLSGTVAGVILGTAAYMSPEQAKGQRADARSDIWSFGVVLYEMLTGKAAFEGETLVEILSGVMKTDPDWTALPPLTPAGIRGVLRRCLQKDRDRRFRDIADVKIQIEDAVNEPPALPVVAGRAKSISRVAWVVASVLVLATAGLSIPAIRYLRQASIESPEMRTEIVTPPFPDPMSFAISPDGRQVVFAATNDGKPQLWLRPLGSETSQPLAGTEGGALPFWSPDSRSIAFFSGNRLLRLDLGGGAPQLITATKDPGRGGSWNADGTIVFTGGFNEPLSRVPATGGAATVVTELGGHGSHRFPQFLPDGRQFLFFAEGEREGVYLGSLDSPSTRMLTPADTFARYAAGRLFWIRGGILLARPFDASRGEFTGDVTTVANAVAFSLGGTATHAGAFSISADGTLAYRTGSSERRQLQWFNRAGEPLGTLGESDTADLSRPSLAPDGKRVVAQRTVQGNTDLWILDGTRSSRFTFDPANDRDAVWSSDGTKIAFGSNRVSPAVRDLYVKPAAGAAAEELLFQSADDKPLSAWAPDDTFLVFHAYQPDRNLWVLPMTGSRTPWLFLKTRFEERAGQVSPDGRWMTYMSNESGRAEVYVRPFAAPASGPLGADLHGAQWQVSTQGGLYPRWSPDGREIFYVAPDAAMMAVAVKPSGTALDVGLPVKLFETRIVGGGVDANQGREYDVSRDGRFLITVIDSAAAPITILQNWKPSR